MKISVRKTGGILGLTFLSVLTFGYVYGTQPNLDQVLPFILKLRHPDLFPNDPYIGTLVSFPSVYPAMMAHLGRWVSLPTLHWALYLVMKFLLIWGAFDLGLALFQNETTAWLTSLFFSLSALANADSFLGEAPLMSAFLYQTSFVAPLVVWTLVLFLKGSYKTSLSLLAAIYALNPLIGNYLVIALMAGTVVAGRPALRAWSLFFLFSLPWFLWWVSKPSLYAGPSERFIEALWDWYPGHCFPSSWSRGKWEAISVGTAFLAYFIWDGLDRCRGRRTVLAWLAAVGAMWVTATAAAELLKSPRLLVLQFFRSDILFIVLGMAFAADKIRRWVASGSLGGMAVSGLVLLAFTGLPIDHFPFSILVLVLLYDSPFDHARSLYVLGLLSIQLLELLPLSIAQKNLAIGGFLAAFLAAMVFRGRFERWVQDRVAYFLAPCLLVPGWALSLWGLILLSFVPREVSFKLPLLGLILAGLANAYPPILNWSKPLAAAALLCLLAAAAPRDRFGSARSMNAAMLALLFLVFLPLPKVLRQRISDRTLGPVTKERADWEDLQYWAQENTPVDGVFIVPPYRDGFRVLSGRSPVVEWEDGAAMHWAPGFELEWLRRLKDLGYDQETTISALRFGYLDWYRMTQENRLIYANLGEKRLGELAREYGADYVVEEQDKELSLPLAYENKSFRVYRIERG